MPLMSITLIFRTLMIFTFIQGPLSPDEHHDNPGASNGQGEISASQFPLLCAGFHYHESCVISIIIIIVIILIIIIIITANRMKMR